MIKHTQTIRRQKATNCLSVFDHFVKLALKGLITFYSLWLGERSNFGLIRARENPDRTLNALAL